MNAKKFLEAEIKKLGYQLAATCQHRLCRVYNQVNDDVVLTDNQVAELKGLLAQRGNSEVDVQTIVDYINSRRTS